MIALDNSLSIVMVGLHIFILYSDTLKPCVIAACSHDTHMLVCNYF